MQNIAKPAFFIGKHGKSMVNHGTCHGPFYTIATCESTGGARTPTSVKGASTKTNSFLKEARQMWGRCQPL